MYVQDLRPMALTHFDNESIEFKTNISYVYYDLEKIVGLYISRKYNACVIHSGYYKNQVFTYGCRAYSHAVLYKSIQLCFSLFILKMSLIENSLI